MVILSASAATQEMPVAVLPCDRFFIRGLSDWLGMDVYHVGTHETTPAPETVLSAEAGMYLPDEQLGVQFEDDVRVTITGYQFLSRRVTRFGGRDRAPHARPMMPTMME